MIAVYIALLLLSFYLLAVICDEYFVPSLDRISERLKLTSDIAGATLMAVGSSAPELFTALIAVLRPGNHADIGAGTIVGSAIFNVLVIIGAAAAFRRAVLNWQPVIRDLLFYCLSIITLLFVFWDGKVTLPEAILFLVMYVIYVIFVFNWRKWLPYKDTHNYTQDLVESVNKNKITQIVHTTLGLFIPSMRKYPQKYLRVFSLSILAIALLSFVLVESAVGLGQLLHINPAIIALTVLAAGTSIPDLISSVIVAKQGRGDMAVSNAIGSNIFDILFGLGLPWVLALAITGKPISVGTENLMGSVFLLFATVVAVLFLLIIRKWTIGRKAGLLLIALYLAYLAYNINQVIN